MQERAFFEFLTVFLKENPNTKSIQALKSYINRVPSLALSQDIFTLLSKHEIGKENVAGQS